LTLAKSAAGSALFAIGVLALAGLAAGAVRVLPWVLAPAVPLRAAAPFARGLAAVAIECALLVGWPLGWAVAFFRFVESGQARVLQTLGQGPVATLWHLAPQSAAFATALAAVGAVWGRDAGAPGLVATDLVAQAAASCAAARSPVAYAVPFTSLTWLCAPDREPRLVGSSLTPDPKVAAAFSAREARIAGDFRSLDLDDARLLVPGSPPIAVHVASLSIRGLAPWAQASSLPASLRALVLAVSGWVGATLCGYGVLRGTVRTRLGAFLLGVAGPLAALGLMRWLERLGSRQSLFALVPIGSAAVTLLAGSLIAALRKERAVATTDRE
jgi:hypothetical protein